MSQLAAASSRAAPKSLALRMPTPASLRSAARSLGLKKSKRISSQKRCQTALCSSRSSLWLQFGRASRRPLRRAESRVAVASLQRCASCAEQPPKKIPKSSFLAPLLHLDFLELFPVEGLEQSAIIHAFLCSRRPSHAKPNNKPALQMFCSRMLTNESTTMRAP